MAAANFGNGRYDDRLIGVPGEDIGVVDEELSGVEDAGAVQVLYGSAAGLTSARNKLWTQDSTGIASSAETSDAFGWSVAAGDFGKSGYAEAAVGSGEEVGDVESAGVVHVLSGSAGGLTSSGSQMWSQNSRGVRGVAEENDLFGVSLVAANLGRDDHADLAVGAFGENNYAGAVVVLYGSDSGLTSARSQSWSQDSPGIKGVSENSDSFGGALAAADLGKSSYADLAVGVSARSPASRAPARSTSYTARRAG